MSPRTRRKISLAWDWRLPYVQVPEREEPTWPAVIAACFLFACGVMTGVALAAAWLP